MGIKGLFQLIQKYAPSSITTRGAYHYKSKALAIDTNIFLYSFVAAIRKDAVQLVDSNGNPTSHLKGILHRTLNLIESGITPVYVLEGKAPTIKSSELEKRKVRREKLQEKISTAILHGDVAGAEKYSKQLVHVNKNHIKETAELLGYLGIPVIQAPGESEAQCAEFCKKGQVFGIVTRDMDALALGSPVMLRNLHTNNDYTAMKTRVDEINLGIILQEFGLTLLEFIDLCILLGCDYSDTIKGIGPVKALEMIRKFKSIENILVSLNLTPYHNEFFSFTEARSSFIYPSIIPAEYFVPEHFACFNGDFDSAKNFLVAKNFDAANLDKLLSRFKLAHEKILSPGALQKC